jgi:DNA helicase-2/ATP-dependent DNA helicase PcrA
VDLLFPSVRPVDAKGWLTRRGTLPWPLRGDRSALPVAALHASADQADAVDAAARFAEAVTAHLLVEERRLAYVAVTRAREFLLCTGYRWDDARKPRRDSEFLLAVRDACRSGGGIVECWTELPGEDTANPLLAADKPRSSWPYDPLGERRPILEGAARLVAEMAPAQPGPAVTRAMGEWDGDVELLLRERASSSSTSAGPDVPLPRQLSVSQLVLLRRDPTELARRLRRPLPARPAPLARRGTAFHGWLEQRFRSPRLLDVDELPGSADRDAAPDTDLATLQHAFLASQWAERDPVDVEVPFELVVADTIVRGRMDAVFADPDGGFTVVDWKTGRRPAGADADAAAVQLAAYRLAWADLSGTALPRVRALFCYLRDGGDDAPSDLLDRDGIVRLLSRVPMSP